MRHLGSLLAGLLVAPAAWLLLAVGQPRTETIFADWLDQRKYDTTRIIGPLACLAAAGLLLGLIASLRLSPAGPAAAGVLYAAVYGVMLVNPLWGMDTIPERIDLRVFDAHPRTPVSSGMLAVLALCLLTAVFSAKRWRRWPAAAAEPAEVVDTQAAADGQAPADDQTLALGAGQFPGQAVVLGPGQPAGPVSPLPTRVPAPAPGEGAQPEPALGGVAAFPPPATEIAPDDEPTAPALPGSGGDQLPTSPWSGPPVRRD